MKKAFLALFLSIFSLFVFSQEQDVSNTDDIREAKLFQDQGDGRRDFDNEQNDYILIPTLGYSRLGANTGIDFMYRKENGFAMFINLNLAVPLQPIAKLGGLIATTEVYFGYAIKKDGFYAVFSAGPWIGGGVTIHGYAKHTSRDFFMNGHLEAFPSIMFALSFRNDFMYFFNSKVGINFSHTHAVGAHISSWHSNFMVVNYKGSDFISPYYYMLKFGVAIKL